MPTTAGSASNPDIASSPHRWTPSRQADGQDGNIPASPGRDRTTDRTWSLRNSWSPQTKETRRSFHREDQTEAGLRRLDDLPLGVRPERRGMLDFPSHPHHDRHRKHHMPGITRCDANPGISGDHCHRPRRRSPYETVTTSGDRGPYVPRDAASQHESSPGRTPRQSDTLSREVKGRGVWIGAGFGGTRTYFGPGRSRIRKRPSVISGSWSFGDRVARGGAHPREEHTNAKEGCDPRTASDSNPSRSARHRHATPRFPTTRRCLKSPPGRLPRGCHPIGSPLALPLPRRWRHASRSGENLKTEDGMSHSTHPSSPHASTLQPLHERRKTRRLRPQPLPQFRILQGSRRIPLILDPRNEHPLRVQVGVSVGKDGL